MKLRPASIVCLLAFGFLTLSSCVKSYTCQCSVVFYGTPGLPDSTTKTYTIQDTKSGATSDCKGESGTFTNNGITTVETCVLF